MIEFEYTGKVAPDYTPKRGLHIRHHVTRIPSPGRNQRKIRKRIRQTPQLLRFKKHRK